MNVHLLPVSFSHYEQTTCFLLVPNCSYNAFVWMLWWQRLEF